MMLDVDEDEMRHEKKLYIMAVLCCWPQLLMCAVVPDAAGEHVCWCDLNECLMGGV